MPKPVGMPASGRRQRRRRRRQKVVVVPPVVSGPDRRDVSPPPPPDLGMRPGVVLRVLVPKGLVVMLRMMGLASRMGGGRGRMRDSRGSPP